MFNTSKDSSMPDLPSGTITFLFTDLQDSTRQWEKHPQEMDAALQRHDQIIESLTEQHGGFVVRPRGEGDSRFLVFERALDGINAAAVIQQALHSEDWPGEITIKVRMGIHTGEGEYRDGDYYGSAVNRCARLRGIAYGGQTLISQSTFEIVQDHLPESIELLDLGKHPLKGMMRPEHIYQLMAPGLPIEFPPLSLEQDEIKTPTKLPSFLDLDDQEASSTRPVFVGREKELTYLKELFESTITGEGGVLFITGGAGRGKTALIDEFCFHAQAQNANLITVRGNCNAHTGMGDPYLPFREITAMLTGDVESLVAGGSISLDQAKRLWHLLPYTADALLKRGPSLIDVMVHGDALLERTKTIDPENINRLRHLKDLVERKKSGSSDLEQTLLFEQFTNVLLILAEKVPLILFLDDMQWADRASIDLLYHLGKRIKGHPIILIAAYRPDEVSLGRDEDRHPLENVVNEMKRLHGDIFLDLTKQEDEDGDFVDLYLDTEPNQLGGEFRQTLTEHTGGHPLFIVELLRAMIERGDLIKNDQEKWIEGPELDWNKLPARVEAVIEERIGRLEDDLRELLSVASVEGKNFTAQVLARVQEIKERKLLRELSQELDKRHRLIHEQGEIQVDGLLLSRFGFAHQLYQRYLYNNLAVGEKRLLHKEIATVLEDIFADDLDKAVVQLAVHYSQAGNEKKALDFLIMAGDQARRNYANQEAINFYVKALDFIQEHDGKRFEVLHSLHKIYDLTGLTEKQDETTLELMSLSEELDNDELRCDALIARADYFLNTEIVQAKDIAERAVEIAQEIDDQVREAHALHRIGLWGWFRGDYHKSKESLEHAFKLYKELGLSREAAASLHWLSLAYGALSKYQECLETAKESIELSREVGDKRQESSALRRLAIAHYNQKNYSDGLTHAEQALTIHREVGDRGEELHALNVIAINAANLQKRDLAIKNLNEALEIAYSLDDSFGIRAVVYNLLEYKYRPSGDLEKWEKFLEEHLSKAEIAEDGYRIGYFMIAKANHYFQFGQYNKALEMYREIILRLEGIMSNIEFAGTHLLIARAHAELGDFEKSYQSYETGKQFTKDTGLESYENDTWYDLAYISILDGDQDKINEALSQMVNRTSLDSETKYTYELYSWLEMTARLYLSLEDFEKAVECSNKMLEIMESHPSPLAQEQKYFTHAKVLFGLGREEEGDNYLRLAYDRVTLVAEKTKDDDLRQSWLENVRTNREIIAEYQARGLQ
jgi:class 3 adenylate cyclase/tetratricopeptide (TPR) repeat protein